MTTRIFKSHSIHRVVVSLQQYIIYQKGEFNKKGDIVMSDETKIINSERIEALEKRVAELEEQLQNQPKEIMDKFFNVMFDSINKNNV
jgi:cob(I)alamin adenosyltransferase